jgi:Xaa-Pro aminopeptidase
VKRGLVVLDPDEVSPQERADRLARLQERMAVEGVTIALVYGDVHRSDDIGYLTNLCIYWNEGIVAVPAVGEPAFLMKLSPRVHPWMRTSSTVTDLRSGKSFRDLVAAFVDARPDGGPGVIGLVDAALWPAAAAAEVRAAAPGWEIRPLDGVVRDQRLAPSAAELALLREGGRLLSAALDAAAEPGLLDGDRVAAVERGLRGGGYTDVQAELVHGPDGVAAIDVVGQFRFGWLRAARLVGTAAWTAAVEAAQRAAVAAVASGMTSAVAAAAAERDLGGLPEGAVAHVTCVHQADLATGGDHASGAEELRPGAVVAVGVEVLFADGGRVVVADTVHVTADATISLVQTPSSVGTEQP